MPVATGVLPKSGDLAFIVNAFRHRHAYGLRMVERGQLIAVQHKAMLDAVRSDVTAGNNAKIVDLARIGRCQVVERQVEFGLEFSCLPLEADAPYAVRVEIIAHIDSVVITSLSDTVLDIAFGILEKFDRAVRRAVEFLAEGEAARQGKPGDASIIEDEPRLCLCPA